MFYNKNEKAEKFTSSKEFFVQVSVVEKLTDGPKLVVAADISDCLDCGRDGGIEWHSVVF